MKRNTPLLVTVADGVIKSGEIVLGDYTTAIGKSGEVRLEKLTLDAPSYTDALSDGSDADREEASAQLLGLLLNKAATRDANNNPGDSGALVKLVKVLGSAFGILTPLTDDQKLDRMGELKTAIKAAKAAGDLEKAAALIEEMLDL